MKRKLEIFTQKTINFKFFLDQQKMFATDTFTIQLQPKSLFRLCLSVVASNHTLLKKMWNEIPVNLQEILKRRCLLLDNEQPTGTD